MSIIKDLITMIIFLAIEILAMAIIQSFGIPEKAEIIISIFVLIFITFTFCLLTIEGKIFNHRR